ncbi:MAG TPA: serine hydrolase [Pyrinomonadaceae bacterium]|jgi:D-alanyl-D-alanine carboxypeptidase
MRLFRPTTFAFWTIFIVAPAFSIVFAQPAAPKAETALLQKKLQASLDEWHKAGKFPGATLGVCLADGDCFGVATGYADAQTKRRMKPDDIMAAGSVGKTFALAVAMQLVGEGRVGLDDKVEKYLGAEKWFARLPNAKDITVRQLMNHTSGLVRYEFKEQFTKDLTANPDKVWKPEELVAYLLDEKPPFEAGKGWDYSDTNYIVLGMIIERVTGKKFYDEAARRVLRPLKLARTAPQDRREIKGLIQGYAGADNPFGGKDAVLENGRFIINPQFEWTGGGFVSNAEDLARWAKSMYEGKAFEAALLPQVLDGVPSKLGRDAKYGLGVIIRPTPAGLTYGHSGFFPGYMTDMMYFPEHKIAVAVQVNTSVFQNLGKSLGSVLTEAARIVAGKETKETPPQSTTSPAAATRKQFVIVLRLRPKYQDDKAWTEADNKAVQKHFAKLQQMQKDGKLIFAGRTLVKESMGVVVLEVESEAEARRVMEEDDAVRAGIMAAEVLPFQTALIKGN